MATEIRSGLVDLDRKIGSLLPGDLMLVAGRPNSGKSVFALNVAMNCNRSHESTVVLYSNSEYKERVLRRLWDYDGIDHEDTQKDQEILSNAPVSDFVRIKASERKGSLTICDESALSVADIEDDLRFLKKEDNAPLLVIIDYLHLLMCPENACSEMYELRPSANIIALKNLSVSENVPIVLISTVDRMPLEQRHDKRPLLADIPITAEAIEHTDIIILLYREALYSQDNKTEIESLELNVVRSKEGNPETVRVHFNVENIRFENPPLSLV